MPEDEYLESEEEEWVGGYPPWWADWLINAKAAKSKEEARELLLTMRAVEDGHTEEVRRRLDAGVDPNVRLFDGYNSLLRVALERARSPEVASLLIDRGADIEGPWVLHCALRAGSEALVERLLEAGLDPNKRVDGGSLLAGVAWSGDQPMVRLLLRHGADVNGTTTVYPTQKLKVTRVTALMVCSWMGDAGMVRLLLEEGADVRRRDSLGRTALDWARLKKGKRAERVVGALLGAGARGGTDAELGIVDIPDLSKAARQPGFREALSELRALTNARPTRVEGEEGVAKGASAFAVGEETAKRIVRERQQEMLAKGCLIVWSRDVTDSGGACVLALPTTDPCEAVAAVQTAGPNSRVTTRDVIDFLRSVGPLSLQGVGVDFVEARLLVDPEDPEALARRVVKLCPDGQVDDLSAYARYLTETRRLFLWWD